MQNVQESLQNAVIRQWNCTFKNTFQDSVVCFFFIIMFLPSPRMMVKGGCECGSCLARGCLVHNLSQLGQVTVSGTVDG